MTAAVVAQPDAEAWVWAQIRDLTGVTSFAYAATQQAAGWIYAWFIQVDARSDRKAVARDRAEQIRQRMLALPGVPWPEGVVCYVQPVEGPFWLPDLEDGRPRYVARYELRVHPPRRQAASPEGA